MLSKRPLMCISLSFVAGMYILSIFKIVDVLLIVLFTFLVLLFYFIKTRKAGSFLLFLICILVFSLGTLRYDASNNIATKKLYGLVNKENIVINAEVIESAAINESSISFIANITEVNDSIAKYQTNEKARISYYLEDKTEINDIYIPELGDIVSLKGKLTIPNTSMNTGGFDYSRYLKADNIFFQANCKAESIKKIGYERHSFLIVWTNFREKCMGFFDEALPEDEAGVLKAFVIGDKSTISEEISDMFSASGLSHILAVSGLHVAVFISLIVSLLKLLKTSKRKEMFISAIAVVFFVFFTGASVSALRAGVLCIFALIAKLIYRKSDPITTLSFAAALFCLFNPHVIYDVSFMLSFSATAGILLFYESLSDAFLKIYKSLDTKTTTYKFLRNFFDSVAVGLSAQIFVLPLLIYIFNEFSLMSILATVIITPFLTYLLAGSLIFICASFVSKTIALPFAGFVFLLAKFLIFIAEKFGSFTFSKILFGEITPVLLLMYTLFICVILFFVKRHKKAYIVSLVSFTLIFVFNATSLFATRDIARVSFINVGQGDCTLIKAPGNCDILIDAGGYSGNESIGEYTIAPYLLKNGVLDVEYVFISHLHSDHIVGLLGLMDRLEVDKLIIPYGQAKTDESEKIFEKANQKGVEILYFVRGDKLKISENMAITAILPDLKQSMYAKDHNELGMLMRFDYGDVSFLFTGDITKDIEKHIVKSYENELKCDVLKVAHHGSKNSSCDEFLECIEADYAYIPVGRNSYGHPSSETINRLKNHDVKIFRADINKDVTFYFNKDEIKKVVYKGEVVQ